MKKSKPLPAAESRRIPCEEKTGVDLIAEERKRQVEVEGWTPQHDDEHFNGEMALAASAYIQSSAYFRPLHPPARIPPNTWPWDVMWWKPSENHPVKDLVRAGALIAAEIDRLQRIASGPETRAAGETKENVQVVDAALESKS